MTVQKRKLLLPWTKTSPFQIKKKKGPYCILILKFDNTSYFHISDAYSTELGVQNTSFNHKAGRGLNTRLIDLSINCLQQKGCCVNKNVIYTSKLMAFIHWMLTHPFNISVAICKWKCYSLQIIWIRPCRIFHTLKRQHPFQIIFWICRDQPVFLVLSKHLEQKGVEVGKSATKISTILETQILND